ncbi:MULTISPECIES: hypothetical protein [Brevibacillus]|uniref:hypothetical protein n=1 Tax=Brevibacillus TaxID=55080 RepID=UPI000B9B5C1B|nr:MULTISPECIES: hypothetical protein [Brevibacillus]MCG7316151.1 hypothetical protein [Brevibacillus laterosporus]RFB38510.1 hypothetical protein DZB91_01585 [Brevibacillus sp. VP]
MKILIKQYEPDESKVRFTSQYGEGSAIWHGNPPKEGSTYDVEIEIPQILAWDKDIQATNMDEHPIKIQNDMVDFVGKLESVSEDDGCCVVRVGESIILVETEGIPLKVGSFLRVQTKSVILYNNHL